MGRTRRRPVDRPPSGRLGTVRATGSADGPRLRCEVGVEDAGPAPAGSPGG